MTQKYVDRLHCDRWYERGVPIVRFIDDVIMNSCERLDMSDGKEIGNRLRNEEIEMSKTDAKEAMKELTMALLYLSRFDDRFSTDRAWKGYDWDILDKLDAKDYIDKGSPKSKSVYLMSDGLDYAKKILEKYNINDWNEQM